MILAQGDYVLVSHRRMFERDEARYFVGRTLVCEGTLLKVEGFTFVRDLSSGQFVKKDEKRIKIVSLDSPGHIVYQLPANIDIERVDIEDGHGDALLVDGSRHIMNLSEHTHCGHF
jgi:hypothetical protein